MLQDKIIACWCLLLLVLVDCLGAPTSVMMQYPMGVNPYSSSMPMSLRPNRFFYDAIGNWINQQGWLPFEVNVPDAINNIASNVQSLGNGIIQHIPVINGYPGYLRPGINYEDEFIYHYVVIPPFHHHHFSHHLYPWHYFRDYSGKPTQILNAKDDNGGKSSDIEEIEGTLQQTEILKNKKDKTKISPLLVAIDIGNNVFVVEPVFNEGIPEIYR